MQKKKPRTTNIDVRAYAMAKGYRLADIASYLGKTPAWFSISYMSRELCDEDKEMLFEVIDRMVQDDDQKVPRN